tara:strand:+ start:2334 stop:2474 length:141 start_codon:yes stop_codon:yes gene_type:complete
MSRENHIQNCFEDLFYEFKLAGFSDEEAELLTEEKLSHGIEYIDVE